MMQNKYKYLFSDLLRKVIGFPEDANILVRKSIAALKCDYLMATLDKAEKIRAFGHIHVYDAKNAPVCNLELHYGVVKTFNVIDDAQQTEVFAPLRVILLRSHRNDLWSFKKDKTERHDDEKV